MTTSHGFLIAWTPVDLHLRRTSECGAQEGSERNPFTPRVGAGHFYGTRAGEGIKQWHTPMNTELCTPYGVGMSLVHPHKPGNTKYLTLNPRSLIMSLHFPGESMREWCLKPSLDQDSAGFPIKVPGMNFFFSSFTLPSLPCTDYQTSVNLSLVGELWHHGGSPPILCHLLTKSQKPHQAHSGHRTLPLPCPQLGILCPPGQPTTHLL